MQIDTSLLREKFVITEKLDDGDDSTPQEMIARSNRIVLDLHSVEYAKENVVIRTDCMHLCSRMSGRVLENYENKGPFEPRLEDIKWDVIWDSALSDYEKKYNDRRWVAIYYKGKLVYEYGEHHTFFDVIEQFEFKNASTYNNSLSTAEKAFQNAGREVTIDYASNVALSLVMDEKGGRCSTVLRAPKKTTAFHFHLKPQRENENIVVSQGFISAASFLEAVNLSYFIGVTGAKVETEEVDQFSEEGVQMRYAHRRLGEIYSQINSLENRYAVRYRPERPVFDIIIEHVEDHTKEQILQERARRYRKKPKEE